MNVIEKLKGLHSIRIKNWDHPAADVFVDEAIEDVFNAIPKMLAALEAADTLATHVSGILDLKAVGTPENTRAWLENYLKARGELDD